MGTGLSDALLEQDRLAMERADTQGRVFWHVLDVRGAVLRTVFMTEVEVQALVDEANTLAQIDALPLTCRVAEVFEVTRSLTPDQLRAGVVAAPRTLASYHAHFADGIRAWHRDDRPCERCQLFGWVCGGPA